MHSFYVISWIQTLPLFELTLTDTWGSIKSSRLKVDLASNTIPLAKTLGESWDDFWPGNAQYRYCRQLQRGMPGLSRLGLYLHVNSLLAILWRQMHCRPAGGVSRPKYVSYTPYSLSVFKIKIKSSLDTSSGRWTQMYFMKNGTFKASPARPKIKKQVYKYCCIDCQQKIICSCLMLKNSSEVSPFSFYFIYLVIFLTASWWGQKEEPLMKKKITRMRLGNHQFTFKFAVENCNRVSRMDKIESVLNN